MNWAEFGAGAHEVVALVDGVELSRATVTVTVVDATEPYVRGLAKRVELPGFPTPAETADAGMAAESTELRHYRAGLRGISSRPSGDSGRQMAAIRH